MMLFNIFMRHHGVVTLVMENVLATEVDSLVKSLNALNNDGEVYYKVPVDNRRSQERQ
ncbi:hypothetical protein QT327_20305 [Olivibacter sp. 47]|uniref:hypothetical protein n=1 Tax=Olivibacter sp. 47 TaxID=3056486 RepID=UPI0025A3711D|nr:hypothetical protein [Olivibacter sp. 47]MDM8176657.1 hypothetical protein [Olivibacter sp. 47]